MVSAPNTSPEMPLDNGIRGFGFHALLYTPILNKFQWIMQKTNAELLRGLPSTSTATVYLVWIHIPIAGFIGSFFALDFLGYLGILSEKLAVILALSFIFFLSFLLPSSPLSRHLFVSVWNFCNHFFLPPSQLNLHGTSRMTFLGS